MSKGFELINSITNDSSQSDIQKVLDALPFYVMIIDEEHNICLANKVIMERMKSEYGVDNIIGGYWPKVIHGCDSAVSYCPLETSVHQNKPVEIEHYESSLDVWVKSMIYPIDGITNNGKKLFLHMVQDIDSRKKAETELKKTIDKLQGVTQSVIKAMTVTGEKRDPYTAGHQQRVSKLGEAIAKEMKLPQDMIMGIKVAGLVHDIGKIAVPIEILSKPGKISQHEYHLIKEHSQIGFEILKEIDLPWPIADIVLQHHERTNGSGYPRSLKVEDIMIEARVLSVADVVEAMSSHRPYRQAYGLDFALAEISIGKGIFYDSEVVDACHKVFENGFSFANET